MKKIKIFLIIIMTAAIAWSCSEEKLNDESVFKDPDPALLTEFDKWILNNYTYPYNISFKYKMEDIESNMTYDLVPATTQKAIAMAKIIKHLWLEVYDEVAGVDFTRTYIPRVIHLIGSGAYNTNNTFLLGTAEGGLKVTLFRINDLDINNVSIELLSDWYLKTMYHEFAHILHQTKDYPAEFKAISNSDYIGGDWSSNSATLAMAYQLGFVSRYSRQEANEDFVEIIAIYIVRGQANWDSILAQAGTSGAAIINQKLEIIKSYLRNSWNIEIDELRRVFESKASMLNYLDLSNL
ncbi:MAG: putative zinc-binding metallopeptidase [Prevotellaceae bacterium]|jgi:substrate import-associated zinc metallohydrolase lipoprotein|nr:putative zinc-binding metallopeptidase [Prevotellaceae bacterium]